MLYNNVNKSASTGLIVLCCAFLVVKESNNMKKYELNPTNDILQETIEKDVLKRNKKIINLMRLLNNIDENYIISIDGEWGSGKTFFVKQLMHIRENNIFPSPFPNEKEVVKKFSEKYFIVYYNAWQNDNHNDAIESLIYNILNEFPKFRKDIIDNQEIFSLGKSMLMKFIEKSSLGIIKKEDLEKMKTFSDLANAIKTMEEKKEILNRLLDLIADKSRILLVIDELDRCNPNYAVNMLETIKHFYDNKRITTLVVTNNKQLSYTIKHFYGYDFDGYGYLNKIYDTVITLDVENVEQYTKFYLGLLKQTHLPENVTLLLFKYFKFTYRECNKYMSMYRIIEPYTNYANEFNSKKYPNQATIFLPMAIALKIKNIDLYNSFITGKGIEFLKEFFNEEWLKQQHFGYYEWFCEIFNKKKIGDNLIDLIIDEYREIFNPQDAYRAFPYMEAVSMLGNMIEVDDMEEKMVNS